MKNLAAALVLLVLTGPLMSARAEGQGGFGEEFKRVQASFKKLNQRARDYGTPAKAKASCYRAFDADAALTQASVLGRSAGDTPTAEQAAAIQYLACMYLSGGPMDPCRNWSPQSPLCNELLQRFVLVRVFGLSASDPQGAKNLCSSVFEQSPPSFCDIVVDNEADPAKRDIMLTKILPKVSLQEFQKEEIAIQGRASPALCRELGKARWTWSVNCPTMRMVRAAKDSGSSAACGGSGLCLAMLGGKSNVCDPYLSSMRRTYCDGSMEPLRLQLLDQARSLRSSLQVLDSHAPDSYKDRISELNGKINVIINGVQRMGKHKSEGDEPASTGSN